MFVFPTNIRYTVHIHPIIRQNHIDDHHTWTQFRLSYVHASLYFIILMLVGMESRG